MSRFKNCLMLFFEFFKIGLFTFGGGYAMIAVIERTIVERKKWIDHDEYLDVVAIAESTPGPIAINSATYIGYKVAGVFGSVFATLGVVLPSFVIIFLISLVFDKFLQLQWVKYAFSGIQAGVAYLIASAGIKMFKHLEKKPLTLIVFFLTFIALILINLFAINFSSIFLILIGGTVGIVAYLIGRIKDNKGGSK